MVHDIVGEVANVKAGECCARKLCVPATGYFLQAAKHHSVHIAADSCICIAPNWQAVGDMRPHKRIECR